MNPRSTVLAALASFLLASPALAAKTEMCIDNAADGDLYLGATVDNPSYLVVRALETAGYPQAGIEVNTFKRSTWLASAKWSGCLMVIYSPASGTGGEEIKPNDDFSFEKKPDATCEKSGSEYLAHNPFGVTVLAAIKPVGENRCAIKSFTIKKRGVPESVPGLNKKG